METLRTHIRDLLKPPEFPDNPEKTRRAFVLNVLIYTLGLIIILGGGFGLLFVFKEKVFTSIFLAIGLVIIIVSLALLRAKMVMQTSIFILVLYWLIFTVRMFLGGGIVSYDIMFHISGTLIAGLLTGISGIAVYSGMTTLSIISMVIAEAYGVRLPRLFEYPPATITVLFLINLGFTIVPLLITLENLSNTIKRAKWDLDERKAAEQLAQQRASEMEVLYQIGMSFSNSHDLKSMLESIYDYVNKTFLVNTFYIGIYDEATEQIHFPLFVNNGEKIDVAERNTREQPGLIGTIIKNRSLLYLPDLNDPETQQFYNIMIISAPSLTVSFLGVPLLSQGNIIGVMSVQSPVANAYSPDQVRLFENLSVQAASGIERALLLEQLQRELADRQTAEENLRIEHDQLAARQQSMEKVLEMGKMIAQETDLQSCLRLSHQAIQKGLGFDRVGLFLYNAEDKTIQGTYGTDVNGNIEDTSWYTQVADEQSGWQAALSAPKGVSLLEDYQAQYAVDESNEMRNVKQHATLAAWAGEVPVALIAVDNAISQRVISPENIEALRLLAGYIGLSVQNAKLNSELEKRVRERTAQLDIAMSELESFSYSVAHDLRAPLRGMRGFSQIILEEEGLNLTEEAREKLQRIQTSAQTMGELIDALLDFSRLTRIEINRSTIDLGAIASAIATRLMQENPYRDVKITIEENLIADADERLMRILLTNLLDNAWKFTSKTPVAMITVGKQVLEDQPAFFVRDNGAGFDMAFYKKLFGAFQRLHRPDEFPGHGAGLAVVQRIIFKHGGRIWAEGEPGQGATFFFTIGTG